MRDLMANNRHLWYALYLGDTEEVDENGDFTGERGPSYSEPVQFEANLSATRGTQGFTGTGSSYDYFGADIDEHSLIWDIEPERDSGGNVDFSKARYNVTAVARGLVQMKYAIKRRPETEVMV